MLSSKHVLAAIAALAITSADGAMGPAFSTGPVANNTFIRESTATLVLPHVPYNNKGDASLWVGMGTSNGDLIQSIADNTGAANWTIFAYTLVSTSSTTQEAVFGEISSAVATDKVTMHYKYDDTTGNYTQTVTVNGVTVSTLSTKDGYAQGWGSAVECAATDCGTMPGHEWIDAKIILDVADPDYIDTMGLGEGVTGSMTTSDGGLTWDIGTISIPEFAFTD